MKITVNELQISSNAFWLLGPTFAKCPSKSQPDCDSMIMCVGCFNGSDSGVGNLMYRSCDEGEHWTEVSFIEKAYMCDHAGSMMKVGGNAALYTDEKAGVILFTSNESYWSNNNFDSTKKCVRPFYRLSFDNGHSWTDKQYIIMDGMSGDNPIPDMVYGRNFALSMASQTRRADDDSLLVALQCQLVDEEGNLIEPTNFHFFQSGAMHARWNEAALRYDWTMSDYVRVSPSESTRGVFEPTFARLGPEKFLMVMRNSNHRAPDVIGQKFFSVSTDNGYSWSTPMPFTYDDGTTMFSASCSPKLLEHSSGKIYFIGIINEKNPCSNDPRFPLCIAEIDPDTCTVRRDTVTVIDTARGIQTDYSNHGVYEDSRGRIIVYTPFKNESLYGLNRYAIEL